jgi:hypothetical protein
MRLLGATAPFFPKALPGRITGATIARLDVARNLRRDIIVLFIDVSFS